MWPPGRQKSAIARSKAAMSAGSSKLIPDLPALRRSLRWWHHRRAEDDRPCRRGGLFANGSALRRGKHTATGVFPVCLESGDGINSLRRRDLLASLDLEGSRGASVD